MEGLFDYSGGGGSLSHRLVLAGLPAGRYRAELQSLSAVTKCSICLTVSNTGITWLPKIEQRHKQTLAESTLSFLPQHSAPPLTPNPLPPHTSTSDKDRRLFHNITELFLRIVNKCYYDLVSLRYKRK